MRIRATNNVAKLTNVMKLVASSKLRAVEEALNRGRAFGVSMGAARGAGHRLHVDSGGAGERVQAAAWATPTLAAATTRRLGVASTRLPVDCECGGDEPAPSLASGGGAAPVAWA